MQHRFRGIAQLVEQRSPKPRAVSSRLTTPATNLRSSRSGGFVFVQTYSPSHRCAMPAPSGMGPLCPCKEAPSWKELAANAVSRLRKSAFFIFFAAFLFFPLDKPPIFRYNKARSGGKRRTNLSDHGPVAQLVERILGKDEVSSSNLDSSSIEKPLEVLELQVVFCLPFSRFLRPESLPFPAKCPKLGLIFPHSGN